MNDYEKIFGMIFSFILMVIGMRRIADRRKLMKIGIRTEGVIVSLNKIITRNRLTIYPVINFETIKNEKISLSLNDGMPFSIYNIGSKILLIYNKDKPEDIIVVSKVITILEIFISIVSATSLLFFVYTFLFNSSSASVPLVL